MPGLAFPNFPAGFRPFVDNTGLLDLASSVGSPRAKLKPSSDPWLVCKPSAVVAANNKFLTALRLGQRGQGRHALASDDLTTLKIYKGQVGQVQQVLLLPSESEFGDDADEAEDAHNSSDDSAVGVSATIAPAALSLAFGTSLTTPSAAPYPRSTW
ncbi:hypothetical protein MMC11_005411 [Xylographa trunciseda]|nr:hypothetical protein [Xylographa trunciseda]